MSFVVKPKRALEFMKNQPLMEGLSDEDLTEIAPYLEILSFDPGAIVFQEDEYSNDLYLILEGEVNLLKNDEKKHQQLSIGKLTSGDVFGEMSFLDDSPRSCSIKTNSNLILVKISRKALETSPASIQEVYGKILRNITKVVIERLRGTNTLMIKNKNIGIQNLRMHNQFGRLLLRLLLTMQVTAGIFGVAYLSGIPSKYYLLFNYASLFLLLYIVRLFNKSQVFPISNFGLTLKNWSRSLGETIGILAASAGVLGLISFSMNNFKIVPPHGFHEFSLSILLSYGIYVFFLEFILRGVMQTSIQKFLVDLPISNAILYIAVATAACNFYFGFDAVLIVFIVNLLCGYIYSLKNNLLATWLVHMVIGFSLKLMGLLPQTIFF